MPREPEELRGRVRRRPREVGAEQPLAGAERVCELARLVGSTRVLPGERGAHGLAVGVDQYQRGRLPDQPDPRDWTVRCAALDDHATHCVEVVPRPLLGASAGRERGRVLGVTAPEHDAPIVDEQSLRRGCPDVDTEPAACRHRAIVALSSG